MPLINGSDLFKVCVKSTSKQQIVEAHIYISTRSNSDQDVLSEKKRCIIQIVYLLLAPRVVE